MPSDSPAPDPRHVIEASAQDILDILHASDNRDVEKIFNEVREKLNSVLNDPYLYKNESAQLVNKPGGSRLFMNTVSADSMSPVMVKNSVIHSSQMRNVAEALLTPNALSEGFRKNIVAVFAAHPDIQAKLEETKAKSGDTSPDGDVTDDVKKKETENGENEDGTNDEKTGDGDAADTTKGEGDRKPDGTATSSGDTESRSEEGAFQSLRNGFSTGMRSIWSGFTMPFRYMIAKPTKWAWGGLNNLSDAWINKPLEENKSVIAKSINFFNIGSEHFWLRRLFGSKKSKNDSGGHH